MDKYKLAVALAIIFFIAFVVFFILFIIYLGKYNEAQDKIDSLETILGLRPDQVTFEGTACGSHQTVTLTAGQNIHFENAIVISNNETQFKIVATLPEPWKFREVHVDFATSPSQLSTNKKGKDGGCPAPGQFPHQFLNLDASSVTYVFNIPPEFLASITDCESGESHTLFISFHAVVQNTETGITETAWGSGSGYPGCKNWSMYFSYDLRKCCIIVEPPPPPPNACGFRTQTKGGYGQGCTQTIDCNLQYSNPGCHHKKGWECGAISEIVVGCTPTGRSLKFTNWSATQLFLRDNTGGPSVLSTPANTQVVDPTLPSTGNANARKNESEKHGGQLSAQLVTLTISLLMDDFYRIPTLSCPALRNLVVRESPNDIRLVPYAGWTIQQIYTLANQVLGGCVPASPTPTPATHGVSALSDAIAAINEQFVDGQVPSSTIASF